MTWACDSDLNPTLPPSLFLRYPGALTVARMRHAPGPWPPGAPAAARALRPAKKMPGKWRMQVVPDDTLAHGGAGLAQGRFRQRRQSLFKGFQEVFFCNYFRFWCVHLSTCVSAVAHLAKRCSFLLGWCCAITPDTAAQRLFPAVLAAAVDEKAARAFPPFGIFA